MRNLIKVAKSRAGEKPWPASSQAPCRLLVCWNPALTADRHHAVAWVHGLYEGVLTWEAGIFDVAHLTNSKRGRVERDCALVTKTRVGPNVHRDANHRAIASSVRLTAGSQPE